MRSEFLDDKAPINPQEQEQAHKFIATAKAAARKMSANYLQKKKAFESSKEQFRSSGSLDLSRIAHYKTSDDIFRKQMMTKTGRNHGLVCAVDFSGSMHNSIREVAMQFLITALFAKQIKIPFVMYTFTTDEQPVSKAGENPQDALYEGNSVHSPGVIVRKPRFVTIASDSMKEADIVNNYYHILSLYYYKSYRHSVVSNQWTRKYRVFLDKYFNYGATPLLHSLYQSYLLAYEMKQSGIENVNILTISDGDNNINFRPLKREKQAGKDVREWFVQDAIECPYTRRVFVVNNNGRPMGYSRGGNLLISVINRMTRTAGIKTFNLFIGHNLQRRDKLETAVRALIRSHDRDGDVNLVMNKDFLLKLQQDMRKDGVAEVENLSFYDKVMFAPTNSFPSLDDEDVEFDAESTTAYRYLRDNAARTKNLSAIGRTISDVMVADFKLGF